MYVFESIEDASNDWKLLEQTPFYEEFELLLV